MKVTISKLMVLNLLVIVGISSGCDLISPPKKAPAKAVDTKPAEEQPAATAVDNQGPLPPDVLARVGSWTITAEDFNQRLKLLKEGIPTFNDKDPKTRQAVLTELTRQQLLIQEAEESDIAQQKDIKDAVDELRKSLMMRELAQRITKDVVANEEDAKKIYNEKKNLFVKWKFRQIVVDDEATAKNLLVQILQGGNFADLAKANSKDKTATEGGLVSDPSKSPIEVQQNVLALEAGGTSTVFKGPQGFYIVHVDEKTLVPFDEVKKDIISDLTLAKQQDAILEHIKKLEEKTKVEINNDLLGAPSTVKKP